MNYSGGSVTCDDCKTQFRPKPAETSSEDGGLDMGFRCPNGHYYPIAHIDPQGVRIRRRLAELDGDMSRKGRRESQRLAAKLKQHVVRRKR